jgi:predicted nucleic acid-binding protein
MYLIDTDVISEACKEGRANLGVIDFLGRAANSGDGLYVATVSSGELRRGVEGIRRRGDTDQADRLERWLKFVVTEYREKILALDLDAADIWGRLRVADPEHIIDKQIAAIAFVNDLTVVTRNTRDFLKTGVKVLNPFSAEPSSV